MSLDNNREEALFETKAGRGRTAHRIFCSTILIGILLIWYYRLIHIPTTGRYPWIGMLFSEVLFGLYWIITQSGRWQVVYRYPFKDRLSIRHGDKLPAVDIFVCTADPTMEPPSLVINTVLSLMSYNYPSEKLSVYVSDDGGSELTFYALLEAAAFSKLWIPFCNKYNVEPRSPQVYFSKDAELLHEPSFRQHWNSMKKLYGDMKSRIDSVAAKGSVPKDIRDQHRGFLEWSSSRITKQDHQSIVKILIDGWNPNSTDIDGNRLPTLVYLSREKRPGWAHNFKAGSMNALIRVSSEITNAPVILNVDCDMYSNDPDAVREALCFFLDEKQGQEISYVQHPQTYSNVTKNDIYGSVAPATHQIELAGIDGFGGTLYVGTGCLHRRESLCGKKYCGDHRIESKDIQENIKGRSIEELEEASKPLADCSYEKDTLWGKEMGLVYGCPVEDIVTGLTIQCRGWKPVYYNPTKPGFLGVVPTTLEVALVQFKRWAEGMFQIFISKYCPFIYGHGKISLGAQMGYCIYLLWAPLSFPFLYYVIIPPLCLLNGIPLFPKVSSFWFIPFAYVFAAKNLYSIAEILICGATLKMWWNLQRMLLIRRTTSFFFAFFDTVSKQLGLSETSFVLTDKVADDELQNRYEKEIMEFGSSSIFFTITSTVALLNLFSLGWGIKKIVFSGSEELEKFLSQLIVCGMIVLVNLPVFEALFLRSDKGRIPISVLFNSIFIASFACFLPILLAK